VDTVTGASTGISYTPDADFNGTDSFEVEVTDGDLSDTFTVNVQVTAVNDAPEITTTDGNPDVTMSEDGTPTAFSLTLNATDVDDTDSSLDWSISAQASNGSASVDTVTGASTGISYTPDADYFGSDSFEVEVTDGDLSDTFTVNVQVTAVNDAPVIDQGTSVTVNIEENDSLTGADLTLNATDVDDTDSTLEWSISTINGPSNGNASVDTTTGASTGITYTPDADYFGSDSFVVTVTDNNGDTDSITVNVNINQAGNNAPDITETDPVAVTMSEDGIAADDTPDPFSLTLNATDADGDSLNWSISTEPISGTASVDDGSGTSEAISYTPDANAHGSDSFVVTVTDGKGGGDNITVNVTITPVNDAPVIAEGDSATLNIEENGALTAADLTLNATDVDHDTSTLDWSIGSDPTNGSASVGTAMGASTGVNYTPDTDFTGTDNFVVQVADAAGGTASFDVTVHVNAAPNSGPGVTIRQSDGVTEVSEIGSTDSYSIVLNSAPTADVEIMVTSGDPGEATVRPTTLTFTASDWDTPQEVIVTGVDDAVDDGDQTVTISHSASSTDSDYDGISISDVTITVADNDGAEPADTTPPDAPVITSPDTTDSPTPTISGTAEPSSTLRLTVTLGIHSSVVYTTTVSPDGTWSIDLGTTEPISGTFPASGLEDGTYQITATATDAASNTSDATTQTLTVNIAEPSNPAAPVVTSGDTTDSPTPTLAGNADAGVTVTLTIDLGDGTSVTYTTTADGDGNWSIDLANDTPTDGALPEGGLAPGEYPVTVTATDTVGNESTVASFTLTITSETTSDSTTLYLPLIAR
jgi:hypothetical protein